MFIEIRGAEFINKGSELMLRAIILQLNKNLNNVKIVLAPDLKYRPYIKRAELTTYQKIWLEYFGLQWGYLGEFIPKKLRELYGTVTDNEIDVVIDASGFAYSDQWGSNNTVKASKVIKKWKKKGKKIIFMPQAFGPFTNKKTIDTFKIIIDNADLIFARENKSYVYIKEIYGERKNVSIAPDFTNIIEGRIPKSYNFETNRICVIPNYRMIDKTNKKTAKKYMQFLTVCTQYLCDKGLKPFILIHEDDKDLSIAENIIENTKLKIDIVKEHDAITVKGIIGASKGVISSRFHGAVSALSQGIPTLVTAWSHKYKALMEDYNFTEGIVDIQMQQNKIFKKIDLIVNMHSTNRIRTMISEKSELQKKLTFKMWEKVFNVINTR